MTQEVVAKSFNVKTALIQRILMNERQMRNTVTKIERSSKDKAAVSQTIYKCIDRHLKLKKPIWTVSQIASAINCSGALKVKAHQIK